MLFNADRGYDQTQPIRTDIARDARNRGGPDNFDFAVMYFLEQNLNVEAHVKTPSVATIPNKRPQFGCKRPQSFRHPVGPLGIELISWNFANSGRFCGAISAPTLKFERSAPKTPAFEGAFN